jgi:hypothetical protein
VSTTREGLEQQSGSLAQISRGATEQVKDGAAAQPRKPQPAARCTTRSTMHNKSRRRKRWISVKAKACWNNTSKCRMPLSLLSLRSRQHITATIAYRRLQNCKTCAENVAQSFFDQSLVR